MGNFRINEFGEAVRVQNGTHKAGAPAPKKKNLADIMKTKRRQANSAKRTAAETQDFLKWALQNCKNQGDLDAIRDLVVTNGTAKQRKLFEKMERDFAPGLTNSQRRKELAARSTDKKFTKNENFRQAILNAESVDDLKALEREYGKKLPQSLRTTYNSRLQALEKVAEQASAQHAEMQGTYDKLFGYGNGKHPSNTPLGTAQPTSSRGMTWEKYAQQHGGTYTKPFSGVAHADRLAEETIARNAQHAEMQGVYEKLFGEKTPVSEPPVEKPIVDGGNGGKPPVEHPVGNGGKAKGAKSKGLKMPKIGKKGKFALAALALGALGAGIAYLTKSKKAVPTTPSGEPIKPGFVPTDTTKTEKADTIAAAPIVNPVDTIEQQVVAEIPQDAESGKYIIKKGDNCWNIAKAELIKEKGGQIPTDKEVMERTLAIIKRNDLHYEADKYTVLIYPNDTLDIKM